MQRVAVEVNDTMTNEQVQQAIRKAALAVTAREMAKVLLVVGCAVVGQAPVWSWGLVVLVVSMGVISPFRIWGDARRVYEQHVAAQAEAESLNRLVDDLTRQLRPDKPIVH
jgi:hypothetical protein